MRIAKIIDKNLELLQAPIPVPNEMQTLIKVQSFALNRADILQIDGLYGNGESIPGLEVAGVDVISGKAVCALISYGGFAEYVLVHKNQIVEKPKNYSFEEAASLLESLATCYLNIFRYLKDDSTVLIHGGGSGIGTMAISMCKLKGSHVIVTSSDESKRKKCLELGADKALNYKEDFGQKLKNKVDLVLDILGGQYFSTNIDCLKFGGHISLIAVMNGSRAEISLSKILMNNISIQGSTLRMKSIEQKQAIINAAFKEFGTYIMDGRLKPVIDSVFDFNKIHEALLLLKNRKNFGKVVININN